ncbi:MAG: protein NO VEIN domain-containing protein [Solirubrobacteraceae bacterium]
MPDAEQGLHFSFRVGTSLLAEFALSHSPADILRELVQNEYDAGGTELSIDFGPEALVVHGNGQTIDKRGWKRLSVMLGTGLVAGGGDRVDAKVNGIGSKNFGMRSLFLFGDRIDVASGGRRTILDRTRGSLDEPLPDPASTGASGVRITVAYRKAADGPLMPFDPGRELDALRTIVAELAPTLVKLSQPGKGKSLRSVIVRSARLGHVLRWRQTVRQVPGATGVLRRSIRVDGARALQPGAPARIAEIEHQAVIVPPSTLPNRNLPGYFRATGGRVRLGISFRLKRNRLDLDAVGTLYYPLEASAARSGFPFSVSAPFDMNEDRSNIVDPQNSPWNGWLLEEAARFAVRILPGKLHQDYGVDAYSAFDSRTSDSNVASGLKDEIGRLLRTEPCWPTRASRRGRRPVLATASDLVVPDNRALGDFAAATISPDATLDDSLAVRTEVCSFAARSGAKRFTVGSVVRIRCAGQDAAGLATRLDPRVDSDRSFTTFPDDLADLAVQRRFAAALDACEADLKDMHRTDLRRSPTTMTAAGTLAAPDALWVVDEILAAVVPKETTLHPDLVRSAVLSRLCRPFNASRWAVDVAGKTTAETATPQEREALARYVRAQPDLSKKAWAAVRRAPVLLDRRGRHVTPASMVRSKTRGANLLAPAVHLPRSADEANPALRPLRFRTKLQGADLVRLAELVERGEAPPPTMCTALERLPQLLSRRVLTKLKGVAFLEASTGALLAPVDTYIRSERLVSLLGEDAPYAEGLRDTLLGRLGSRSKPSVDDLVAAIVGMREGSRQPSHPDLVVRALVEALRRERRPLKEFEDAPILWTGDRWEAPAECLVGAENRKTFLGAVTVLREAQRDASVAVGAQTTPTTNHWARLLTWVGEHYGQHQRVPVQVVEALKRAYRQLDELPPGVPQQTACLLDDHGRLHSIREAIALKFLINDYPDLAAAAAEARAPVAFAVPLEGRASHLLGATGVKRLSEIAVPLAADIGTPLEHDARLGVERVLSRLRTPYFASAVAALVSAITGSDLALTPTTLAERLGRIRQIVVVDEIRHRYQLAGTSISVGGEYLVRENEILVAGARASSDLRRSVAAAIATVADRSALAEQLLGDPLYFLLRCRTAADIRRELHRRKVVWEPDNATPADDSDDVVDDESAVLADAISRSVVEGALHASTAPGPGVTGTATTRSLRRPLPDLQDVTPRPASQPGEPHQRTPWQRRGGGWPVGAVPRDFDGREDDRLLGRRGEEIVLAIERARVADLGESLDRVVWTSDAEPFADHDIKSVDDDGEDLWIEVKSTTGRDGRFSWPGAEFRLAVRARSRYALYRVYEADTTTPTWSCVRDPIGQFETGGLRLDLDRLVGDVGPLEAEGVVTSEAERSDPRPNEPDLVDDAA